MRYSYEEYVRYEREAREPHEFVGGLILAMAGRPLEHGGLNAAVISSLGAQLAGRRCAVFGPNTRVRVQATGNAYYPDASVVCGEILADPEDALSIANPTVLVEVLSPSTAEYDRTDKLEEYRRIPSLRHVVHVAYDESRIDVWSRVGDTWTRTTYGRGQVAPLEAIACVLEVDALYRNPLAV
jgi:Uma2 family endonuclease